MPSRQELVVRANAVGITATNYPNDSKLEQKVLWAEKNATAFTGTLATGKLTSDATQQSDGDKVKIGDITYTFKTALSEVKAANTLTAADTPHDGDTVTIDGITYVFRDTVSSTLEMPYVVHIGTTAAKALDNLKSAINDTGTEGTDYGIGTVAHPTVTAETNTNTTQVVQAKNFGTYANGFVTVETSSHLSWADDTLGGATATAVGVDPVPYEVLLGASAAAELDNLKIAINASGGTEGTEYSTGTPAHPLVTATTNTNTTQVVQAIDYSVTNTSIATTDPTDTGNHMSWGAATLESGIAKVVAANTTTALGGPGLSGDKNVG